jgi:hypothetical protein
MCKACALLCATERFNLDQARNLTLDICTLSYVLQLDGSSQSAGALHVCPQDRRIQLQHRGCKTTQEAEVERCSEEM